MELQATVPFALNSSSSFPSPGRHHEKQQQQQPTHEEIQDSFLKLQRLMSGDEGCCNVGVTVPQNSSPWIAAAATRNVYSVAASTTSTSNFTNASYHAAAAGSSSSDERPRSSSTGNTFAYLRDHAAGSSGASQPGMNYSPGTTTTIPRITPCLTTLQQLIQKCGVKPAPLKPKDGAAIDPSTVRLLGKLQNLNEILQNLDESFTVTRNLASSNYESSRPVAIPATVGVEDRSCSTYVAKWLERCSPATTTTTSRIDAAAAATFDTQKASGKLSFTESHVSNFKDPLASNSFAVAPINPKPISRQDFRAQVEKLTGNLKKQWPETATTNQLVEESKFTNVPAQCTQSFSSSPQLLMTTPPPPPQKARLLEDSTVVDPMSVSSSSSSSRHAANISNCTIQMVETSPKSTSLLQQIVDRIELLEQRPPTMLPHLVSLKRLKQRRCRVMKRRIPRRETMQQDVLAWQKQVISSIQQHLARNDVSLQSIKQQLRGSTIAKRRNASSVQTCNNGTPLSTSQQRRGRDLHESLPWSNNAAESSPEDQIETCKRRVKSLEKQYLSLSSENQKIVQTTKSMERQCHEHSLEIQLCWSAINQLCIDNEFFRTELQQQRALCSDPVMPCSVPTDGLPPAIHITTSRSIHSDQAHQHGDQLQTTKFNAENTQNE